MRRAKPIDKAGSLCYTPAFRGRPQGRLAGRIAQLVEQLTLNQRVAGSSPAAPTNKIKDLVIYWISKSPNR